MTAKDLGGCETADGRLQPRSARGRARSPDSSASAASTATRDARRDACTYHGGAAVKRCAHSLRHRIDQPRSERIEVATCHAYSSATSQATPAAKHCAAARSARSSTAMSPMRRAPQAERQSFSSSKPSEYSVNGSAASARAQRATVQRAPRAACKADAAADSRAGRAHPTASRCAPRPAARRSRD